MRKARTTLRKMMLLSLGVAALIFSGCLPKVVRPADFDEVEVEVTDSGQTYTVREGEDIYVVAIRLGVSPRGLRTLNNLPPMEVELNPGMVLKIPK